MPPISRRRPSGTTEGTLIHEMIELLLHNRTRFPRRLLGKQIMSVLSYFNLCVSQGVTPDAKVIHFLRDAAQPFASREVFQAHNSFSETQNDEVISYQLSMLVANGAVSRLQVYASERRNELICVTPGVSIASDRDAELGLDDGEMGTRRSQLHPETSRARGRSLSPRQEAPWDRHSRR